MTVPASVRARFDADAPTVQAIASRVRETLVPFAELNDFMFVERIKTLESVYEKIETGRFKSWDEIDDRYACTVVVPTSSYEAQVTKFIQEKFEIEFEKKRGSQKKDPSVFRFDSPRIGARLSSGRLPKQSIHELVFEIQIRTVFEHAWSCSTHALAYKTDRVDWKKLRLAAQLKALVEQVDLLIEHSDKIMPGIGSYDWPDINNQQTIEKHFRKHFDDGLIPSSSKPENWSRFSSNFYSLAVSSNDQKTESARKRKTSKALKIVSDELNSGAEQFPISLSVIQYSIGVLHKHQFLPNTLTYYMPYISDELASLYASTSAMDGPFKL